MSSVAILLGCLLAQVIWLQASPSAWLVPDLALLGLVLGVTAKPERWFSLSLLAAGATTIWSIRWLPVVFAGMMAIGWGVRQVTTHWDARDIRIQALLIALGGVAMSVGELCLDRLSSVLVWALAALRVAITLAVLPIVKALLEHKPHGWFGNNARWFMRRLPACPPPPTRQGRGRRAAQSAGQAGMRDQVKPSRGAI